ncbi:uracil phosphoribosyltransferase [candidate division KSB1 bacterium]|nr:uracil phosphoribosyltransferase [candidate division KSB1 bacterium]
MKGIKIVQHPLVQHKLTFLRNRETEPQEFRRLVQELTSFMMYEVMADCPLRDIIIRTPMKETSGQVLAKKISIITILRAGLGMVDALLALVPTARVGHIGLYRDPETLNPVEYYVKMPESLSETDVVIVDPLLATGRQAEKAVEIVKNAGARDIKFVCVIASPEGVQYLRRKHRDVPVYTAALDEKLDENGYILPGLGDAGDRLYGTK